MKAILSTIAILALSLAQPLHGDTIELADGRKISGTLSRTGNVITIKSDDGKMINVKPSDIAHVTLGDGPAAPSTKLPVQQTAAETKITAKSVNEYLVIPLVGEFGKEIDAESFQNMLSCNAHTKQVFLYLDSIGGDVATARKISDSMHLGRERGMKFHVLVKNGLSASIWVIFNCDDIYVEDTASIGAAVAFSTSDTGAAQVSNKFNSAVAAEIAGFAENNGYSGAVVRAMIQLGAEAYAWRSSSGAWQFDNKIPTGPDAKDMIVLSDGKNILTLTAKDAVRVGMAKGCQSIDDLKAQSGITNLLWASTWPQELSLLRTVDAKVQAAAKARNATQPKPIDGPPQVTWSNIPEGLRATPGPGPGGSWTLPPNPNLVNQVSTIFESKWLGEYAHATTFSPYNNDGNLESKSLENAIKQERSQSYSRWTKIQADYKKTWQTSNKLFWGDLNKAFDDGEKERQKIQDNWAEVTRMELTAINEIAPSK